MSGGLEAVQERIRRAGGDDVTLVAVSKGFDVETVRSVLKAGCYHVGESYAQEAVPKLRHLRSDTPRPTVHFIGHLQTNKVRALAGLVDLWETVDRPSLIDELARWAPGASVLIQVNTTGEASKHGAAPSDVPMLLEHARASGLCPIGLMTIGPTLGGPEQARPAFRLLRSLVDAHGLEVCSMGMSGDLEVAISEGSTEVRVGTAIFGPRPPRGERVG